MLTIILMLVSAAVSAVATAYVCNHRAEAQARIAELEADLSHLADSVHRKIAALENRTKIGG